MWRDCPNKADQEAWKNFQVNLEKFREERKAKNAQRGGGYGQTSQHAGPQGQHGRGMMTSWEQQGCPSQNLRDQIKAIADENNAPELPMTLLTTLKQSLDEFQTNDQEMEEKKMPPKKKSKWKKGTKTGEQDNGTFTRNFLLYVTPEQKEKQTKTIPRTMLGAPPKKKHPFKIAFDLPFLKFPIGDGLTKEDAATLSGLLDTGGCCNMGWLTYHRTIWEQYPQLVRSFTELEEEQHETINIGGLKDRVILTHMMQHVTPYEENNKRCYLTLGLTEDLPIDTLFGLGFQQDLKMKIDFATKRVESALLQASYQLTFKAPRRTNPDRVRAKERNVPKSLITIDK
jgi:hypothetical protein